MNAAIRQELRGWYPSSSFLSASEAAREFQEAKDEAHRKASVSLGGCPCGSGKKYKSCCGE